MLKYKVVPVTPYEQNCSIVWCDETMVAAVIDPGGDVKRIEAAAKALGVKVEQVWITHGHMDHAGGAAELAENLNVPIIGPHEGDLYWLDALSGEMRKMQGFENARSFVPAQWLHDGDVLTLGKEVVEVKHCPGHTPGHVVFYVPSVQRAFVGDVLFAGSVGRTDFPGGDWEQLRESITQKLWPLGNDVVFVSGHGPESTFGRERQTNPYVGDGAIG